ncbi:ribonuclease HII [Labrys monachus]|uniref:Ribonuclease HII n=1 Tax=Labrys monachus TaxID=217067 RepID=A0ABU0FB52_9HYPH|nr:ribonuclease HII [Labrys monachus]MDQ0391666.1 ribonuclease HII [Labrys monachus]
MTNSFIAGVDEAGRGPLAGPVAAAAVILDPAHIPAGLADSKVLTAARRQALYRDIMGSAIAVSVAFAGPATIERLNIRVATLDAMRRAVRGLSVRPSSVEIDGKDVPHGLDLPARAIVDGDALVPAISAASIIAKVTRDNLMVRLAAEFPAYGFERHMGYGTPEHTYAIEVHGPTQHHRLTFGRLKAYQA